MNPKKLQLLRQVIHLLKVAANVLINTPLQICLVKSVDTYNEGNAPSSSKFSFSRNIYHTGGLKNNSEIHLQESVYNMQ
jgi:hypothetical protein